MPRATYSVPSHRKRKKVLKHAKGYWGGKSRLLRSAKESVERAWQYAYRDRRQRRRDFRRLWIARINAALRLHGLSYSKFLALLREKHIDLDRKQLAELAVSDPAAFQKVVESVQD